MIVFEKFGKTVRISNRHWKSLRARFNPDNAKKHEKQFRILRYCLLCREHVGCERCGFYVFEKWTYGTKIDGCGVFLRRLLRPKPVFYAANIEEVTWDKEHDDLARRQLMKIQKFMDKIEAQQKQ